MWNAVAPEVMNPESLSYTVSADIYSLAMIFYELGTGGGIPFEEFQNIPKYLLKSGNINKQLICQEIIAGLIRPTIPKDFLSDKFSNLVQRCWTNKPENRPSAQQVLQEIEAMLSEGKSSTTHSVTHKRQYTFEKSLPIGVDTLSSPIWSLGSRVSPQGTDIYAGSEDGSVCSIQFLPQSKTFSVQKRLSLNAGTVYSLFSEKTTLWCGTSNGQLFSISHPEFVKHDPIQIFPQNWIVSCIERVVCAGQEVLWCGTPTDNCCIAIVHPETRQLLGNILLGSEHPVSCIKHYEKIWVGCLGNIILFNSVTGFPICDLKVSARSPVLSITQQAGSNLIWCTAGVSLFAYDSKNCTKLHQVNIENFPELKVTPLAQCILTNSECLLCTDTVGCIHVWDTKRAKIQTLLPPSPLGKVLYRCVTSPDDHLHSLWVSSVSGQKGIFLYMMTSATVDTVSSSNSTGTSAPTSTHTQ
eukprot:TRINITY_DN18296_c0_g1_i1.p1 TRINITY_DN18296_c0_g1~~TRINITY_DN18296_c0_g1_i1.p1  ORF type:complete len:469 (-),score=53.67 TRINITY_DN18296_c0_g1_i1:110-1516(-)